jgi:hypothetical protein
LCLSVIADHSLTHDAAASRLKVCSDKSLQVHRYVDFKR